MDLSGILREECIQIGTDARDKRTVLEDLTRMMRRCRALAVVAHDALLQRLMAREALGSTGFGDGIAIPHCFVDGISEFVVGILVAADGVEFDTLDGEPARLLVCIVGPSTGRQKHIRILATVSQVLRLPGAVAEMLAERSSLAILESFLRYSRDEVDTQRQQESCLFHVLVQSESKFYDILQVFTAMETCSVSVTEAKEAGDFLQRIPLFASFWREERPGFNRIITAVVKRALANDTIRQVNDIAGGLDKNPGIVVTVQDLFFAAGSLSP